MSKRKRGRLRKKVAQFARNRLLFIIMTSLPTIFTGVLIFSVIMFTILIASPTTLIGEVTGSMPTYQQKTSYNSSNNVKVYPPLELGGYLNIPVYDARISSLFGWRTDPVYGNRAFHAGVDFAAPIGTPIHAMESGTVIQIGYTNVMGYYVTLDHGKGMITRYQHIKQGGIKVNKGDEVQKGDIIAEVGTTGKSTGAHLHAVLNMNGVDYDLLRYLPIELKLNDRTPKED